jgi:curved DNA-binding protein CbpA
VSEKLNPWAQVAKKPQEKALSYFNSCLEILGLQEDVILTEAELKAAYKKAAIKVHPDKGGSEEMFQAVTKAYTYLSEILKRIQGAMGQGQAQAQGPAQAPQQVATQRAIDEEKWQHIQPVHLSAKKLDINAFNSLYEKTRMPDPDDEGYGDWLKTEDQGSGATGRRFDGKFNRDVFNSAFEGAEREKPTQALTVQHPRSMALTMAPSMGTEIGRTSTDDYTAPANADVQYTDLKRAYTSDSTFTNKVADVKVEVRTMDRYAAEREKAPVLSAYEQSQIALEEERMTAVESQRERRLAAQREQEEKYFQQMKRLAIMNK